MSLPVALYRVENLQRAWRWIRSNPDRGYKTYFRDHYSAYAIAEAPLLKSLSERLRRGTYVPSPSCKIFFPKASGVLRPYTLLDVEDQIVYQAAANVVAEAMFHRVRSRYLKQVFGHLYAGKSNLWFYRKWSSGYKAFNKAATEAHAEGNTFTASFDLTAFYDSIDHRVLTHFLDEFHVSRDVSLALQDWLSKWTGTDAQILQGHGIPQGPLSSGLIAETVLSHLDNHGWAKSGVTYLRYVDDIRLFARTEHALRAALIRLDHLSKDIGLFPQAGKISIHHVSDIRTELKSISQPVETVVRSTAVNQDKLFKRLVTLSPRFHIEDTTRFKYLLAHAMPHARLTDRLWKILDRAPEIYDPVARYLARANKLSRRTSREVVDRVVGEKLYPAVAASFLRAIATNIHLDELGFVRSKLKPLWAPKTRAPDFTVALGQWLLAHDGLTERQSMYVCAHGRSSWIRSSLLLAANEHAAMLPHRSHIAAAAIKDGSTDPAICGAVIAGKDGVCPPLSRLAMQAQATLVLKEFGLLRRARGRSCGIELSLGQILGALGVGMSWRRFFRVQYKNAERQIVGFRGYAGTDASAWVQGLDVFNEFLLEALFALDGSLGGYTLGNIGQVTCQPSRALQAKFPITLAFVTEVHNKRYESHLAHPVVRTTGVPTRRIPFSFIKISKQLMRRAIRELDAAGLV
ncbi:MAG: RNA-directed DNA polymerase [Rhodanobacter sp.]